MSESQISINTEATVTSSPAKRKRVKREVELGCIVSVRRKDSKSGIWEDKEFELAVKTDLTATPQKIGPELPLHQALLGKHRHQKAVVRTEYMVVNFRKRKE